MLLSIRPAMSDKVVHNIVEQRVVRHKLPPSKPHQPAVPIGLASRLDRLQARADLLANQALLLNRQLNFAFMVGNTFDWGNYGRCACSECFRQVASAVGREDLLDRDRSLLYLNPHLNKQRQNGVARNAGQDGSAKRWCNRDALDDEEDVHHSALFDEPVLEGVQPEDVVISTFLSKASREEASSVVPSGLDVSGPAGKRSHVVLLGKQPKGL